MKEHTRQSSGTLVQISMNLIECALLHEKTRSVREHEGCLLVLDFDRPQCDFLILRKHRTCVH